MSAANVIVACVFALLAIVAWASAWKTMEWLGDAEDLIDQVRTTAALVETEPAQSPSVYNTVALFAELVDDYERRTPRRST